MNKDYLKHLIRTDCFGLPSEVAKSFNKAVVDLAVKGENNFTTEMLVDMVTAQFYDNEKQKEAIMFCFDKIAEALTKPVQVMQNYIPELSNEWPNWAIDSNGEAYHYKMKPHARATTWGVTHSNVNMRRDDNFPAFQYRHMWENDAWKNSLQQSISKVVNYVPVFEREEDESWAIDGNGTAYFYENEEDMLVGQSEWRSDGFYHRDSNFDKNKFTHMWENDAWKNSKVVKQTNSYTPVFPEGKTAWAIDSNGEAYYYKTKPNKNSICWSGSDWIMDEEFDKEKFKSMWADDLWETSLVENTVDTYVPNFKYQQDSAWAIDSSGEAYFYENSEDMACGSQQWGSDSFFHKDYNFDKVKYEHMWKGIAWTNSKIVKESKDYTPVYPDDKGFWAIDEDGDAYFYRQMPHCCRHSWTNSHQLTIDNNFDSDKYKHMWDDGAWKNSLKCK